MAIRELLEQGDYLALLSHDQVARPVAAGHLVRIGAPLPSTRRSIGLTTLSGFRPTRLQSEFLDIVKALAAERTSQNPISAS